MRIMNFRVSILAVVLLFLILFPILADESIQLKGEGTNVSIYSPSGKKVDPFTEITESGYIIRTTEEAAYFTAPFGYFALEADSILVIDNYNEVRPSLYLVSGAVSITVKGNKHLSLYSPTEVFRMSAGTYSLEYTEYRAIFTNLSEKIVSVKDSLRGNNYTVTGMHTVDLMTNKIEKILNMSSTRALKGTIASSTLIFDYTIGEGKAIIGHGYALSELETQDFLRFAAEYDMRISSFKTSVYPGKIIFYFPAKYSNSTALEIIKNALEKYDVYLGKYNVPSNKNLVTDSTTSETYFKNTIDFGKLSVTYKATRNGINLILPLDQSERIKQVLLKEDSTLDIQTVKDGLYIPRKGTAKTNYYFIDEIINNVSSFLYTIGGNVISGFNVVGEYTVNYAATLGVATISYSETITDEKAIAFFNWLSEKNPMIATNFICISDGVPGRIELYYPITMTPEEIKEAAEYIALEANKYVRRDSIPAAPYVEKGILIKRPLVPRLMLTMQPSK
ncbi:MAG: hypothetical protein K6G51_02865 [Sphaerochaetaceae bacterium]|nr:hypothetical protein [Sphaerochaetaceae bacterium]